MIFAAGSARSQRRQDVQGRLFAAVEKLCSDGLPFANVSVSELVGQAGISRASFYLYYPDRSSFLVALAVHVAELLVDAQAGLLTAIELDRERYDAAMAAFVETYARSCSLIVTVADSVSTDAAVSFGFVQWVDTAVENTAQAISRLQSRGLAPGLPPVETAASLVWMVLETSRRRLAIDRDEAARGRLAHAMAAITWATIHG